MSKILNQIKIDQKNFSNSLVLMKTFLISGLVDDCRIKTNIFAISPNHAIKVFQQKYPSAIDIYVIQNLFKK